MGFFGLFLVVDIIAIVVGGAPALAPSCAVYVVCSLIRSDEWPNEPKFAEYVKIYILVLAFTLMPGLICVGFSNIHIISAVAPDSYMAIAMGTFFGPLLIPLIIVLGSDPTNRYGNIEKERVIGGLLVIAGVIIGLIIGVMGLVSGQYVLLDTLAIVFTIAALVISVLIFLSIKLGNV